MKEEQRDRIDSLFRQMKANEISGGLDELRSAILKDKGQKSKKADVRFWIMLFITLCTLAFAVYQTWRLHTLKEQMLEQGHPSQASH